MIENVTHEFLESNCPAIALYEFSLKSFQKSIYFRCYNEQKTLGI